MEELKRFQGSTFDTIARRSLIEDQDTILELTGKIQELQNEVNCLNDSRDFQDAESVRSGLSHVTRQLVSFPPHPVPGGMLSRSIGMPSRTDGPPSIWDTHSTSGNVFANPAASSSALYPQELNPWSSHMSEPMHSSTAQKNENQTPLHIAATNWEPPKYLGYIRYIRKRFCTSTSFLFSSVSSRIEFYLEENCWRTNSHVYSGEKWKTRTRSRSEMPVRTVSQEFSHPQWGRFFKELWGRPTTTADCRSSFRQIPHTSNVCLLEDKIQNRGMYLFTISYGSDAMDQRSGDGLFSGWSKIFVICKRNSNARFWSTRCEDCFTAEQNHPQFSLQKKNQSGGTGKPKKRTVSFAEDRLLTWSTSTSGSLEPMILSGIIQTYLQLFFEMTIFRNSIRNGTVFFNNDENPTWWHLGRIVQIKNTRVWETQDHFGIVRLGDPSEASWTWWWQIEDNGKKKYRARFTK